MINLEAGVLGGRFSTSIGLVGVDIGSRAVKLLQLREQDGSCEVVGAGMEYIREETSDDAGLSLAERLRRVFSSNGFTGRRCVVSLPRSVVQVQSIRLPSMSDPELQQAARWEASQRFQLSHDAMEVQAIRTGAVAQGNENREEVLLIAASREHIEKHLQPILEAGLRPMAVDTDFGAIARFFTRKLRRAADRDHVTVVLDVGASGSTILILRGDQIAFCKPFDLGGHRFNEAVAEHLQIDEQSAIKLRAARLASANNPQTRDVAGETDRSTDRALFEAVRPLIDDLIKEITLCLRYFSVTFRGAQPKHLILTGGDGSEPRLGELIEKGCNVSVVHDDNENTLNSLHPQIEKALHRRAEPATCWSVAAGLSVRNLVKNTLRHQTETATTSEQEVAA